MTLRTALVYLGVVAALSGACQRRPDAASPSPGMTVTPVTPPSPSPLPDPLPEVVAMVGGRPVPLRHARIIVQQSLQGRTPSEGERATAYRRAVEQLIARELLYQEAALRKIQPEPKAVEELRRAVRREYSDEKAFKEFLTSQGLDPKTFVEELQKRSMVEVLLRQEAEKVPITVPEEEARAYHAANPNIFESAGRPLPFENVRERITSQLVTFKRAEALNGLLKRLRSAAKVEILI
jgi:hypothetical protein